MKKTLLILISFIFISQLAFAGSYPCDKSSVYLPLLASYGIAPSTAHGFFINCRAETKTQKIYYMAAYAAATGTTNNEICDLSYSDLAGDDFGQLVNVACKSNIELIYFKYQSLLTLGVVSYPVTLDSAVDGTCEDWNPCLEDVYWEFNPYPATEPVLTDGLWEKTGATYQQISTGDTCTYYSKTGFLDCEL